MNRFALFATMAVTAALIAPAASVAGGWATVGLSSLPEGTQPGEPWVVQITVLQHGRTPLEGVAPRVLLRDADGAERSFAAKPTSKAGVYEASVMFPTAGRWTYLVDDDFTQVHELGSVRIGAGGGQDTVTATTGSDGISLGGAVGIALGAGVLAALFTAALRRRQVSRPAEG